MMTSRGMCKSMRIDRGWLFNRQQEMTTFEDEDNNVDHAKKGRKVGREAMIPNDTVM